VPLQAASEFPIQGKECGGFSFLLVLNNADNFAEPKSAGLSRPENRKHDDSSNINSGEQYKAERVRFVVIL